MTSLRNRAYALLVCFATLCGHCFADSIEEARETSEDVVIFKNVLQIKPDYTLSAPGGWQYMQNNRVAHPYPSTLIPGLRIGEMYSLMRFEAPIIYQTSPKLTQWGAQDFTFLDLAGGDTRFGAAGIGYDFSFPTATSKSFGSGKWSIGPSAGLTVRTIADFRASILLQQFFSFAGDSSRPRYSQLWVQPFLVKNFGKASFLQTDPIYKFDWINTTATLPVNLAIGNAFSPRITASLGPEWVVNGSGNWSVKAAFNYLNW